MEGKPQQKKYHKELNSTTETIIDDPRGYKVQPVSKMARLIDEFTTLGKKRNLIWTFTEVDVTDAKRIIKEYKQKTGISVSFTAFIISVFSRVVSYHKNPINAMLKRKKQLLVFDDVDCMTNIERVLPDGTKKPVSYTIRKAHQKTLKEISEELATAKKQKKISVTSGKKKKWISALTKNVHNFPKFLRKIFLNWMFNDPMMKKKSMGTVNVTAVGMFGSGLGHMIHLTPHTCSLGVGGMDSLPFNYKGEIINRDLLGLTLALDHSVIDGAPAARFFHDLRQWFMHFCFEADWCFKSLENFE